MQYLILLAPYVKRPLFYCDKADNMCGQHASWCHTCYHFLPERHSCQCASLVFIWLLEPCMSADISLWSYQAAPYVAALAACYAEAQAPPVQLFHIILEVSMSSQLHSCALSMCWKPLLETWLALLAAVVITPKITARNCCELPICLLITVLTNLSFVGSTIVLYDIL